MIVIPKLPQDQNYHTAVFRFINLVIDSYIPYSDEK